MSEYGQLLLSKVIDDNNVPALATYGIQRGDFGTAAEQRACDYILSYAAANGGAAPSYAAFAAENPDILYVPAVTDSYEFLARSIKDAAGKRQLAEIFNKQVNGQFDVMNTEAFVEWMTAELSRVKAATTVVDKAGMTLPELAHAFQTEYERRKAGKSFKLWRTPFPSVNEVIGGLYSGDVYGILAESGRGKTYLSEVLIDELLRQGARVLVKSYEVKAYPWLSRLLSIITAREGAITDDMARKVGLPNKALLAGALEGDLEAYFFQIIGALGDYYPGTLYLQAKSDPGLTRTLDDLERELLATEVDVVVIDAFYNLADCYGRNANKTAGGAAEMAARRMEQIVGERDVVCIYTVQAHTERKETDEDGLPGDREIKLPDRDRMKTTKALLEITTNLFSFDSVNGYGRLGLEKGRNGGEGFTVDLIALLDFGVLAEMPSGEEVAGQFVGNF